MDKKNKHYDIRKIFEQMELDLISSMHRAFYFHKNEEIKEGFKFEQWQLSKLRALEEYRKRNKKLVKSYNKPIQNAINYELKGNYRKSQTRVAKLINKVKSFFTKKPNISFPTDIAPKEGIREYFLRRLKTPIAPQETNFFGANDKKLNALQEVVTNDLKKAQTSVLRKMDDVYRQTIYKTNVYMQSGTKTLNQAIDMATKDFLDKGINSIIYKDGKRVNIASYAEMCLRTASQRATFLGEGKKRDEYGIHLVVVSAHANTCEMCEPWQGQILIDDVFSHPSKEYIAKYKNKYKLLSEAIDDGLMHPNCRHTITTYFAGITQIPQVQNGEEAIKAYRAEQKQRAYERAIRKQKRIVAGTCDEQALNTEKIKLRSLQRKLRQHIDKYPELRRNYEREKPRNISNKTISDISKALKVKAQNDKIKEARDKILNNEYNLQVRQQKQKEHIQGDQKWIDYFKRKVNSKSQNRPTMFNKDVNVQQLVNQYKGSGIIEYNRKNDVYPREYIDTNKIIGKYWDESTMKYKNATRFVIVYSSKGVHAFPIRPLNKEGD